MTIYEKLAEARVRFQDSNIKMTGENSFAKYKYFELSDILPVINRLGKELGFVCIVSFSDDLALLTVKDISGEGEIVFTSPMSTANLKGCHEVQNLGAVETYIKRYLYQNAFEIVEADALNSTHNPNEKPKQKQADPERERCIRAYNVLKMTPEQLIEAKEKNGGSYKKTAEYLEGLIVDKEAKEKE